MPEPLSLRRSETMPDPILDPPFLKKLERLALVTRRPFAGQMKGEKRSRKRGSSIEFADYREYVAGDDLRYVDWNMAARSDRMFLKLFVEEEDLLLVLLIDASKSMDFGTPKKLQEAVQIAAALGYIALVNFDRVSVQAFASSVGRPMPVQRGRAGVLTFFDYLNSLQPSGAATFSTSLKRFAAASRTKGVAVVLSDFYDPEWQTGLRSLLAGGFQVAAIQILSPDELSPPLRGDLRIIDSETGESKEMSVNPQLLDRYQRTLSSFCAELEVFSHRYGVDYLRVSSDLPVEDIVLRYLRRSGLLK